MPRLVKIRALVPPMTCLPAIGVALALFVAIVHGETSDRVLTIEAPAPAAGGGPTVRRHQDTELLQRSDTTRVTVDRDPAYAANPAWKDKPITYTAVPLASLLEGLAFPDEGTVQFHCLDGFSAAIAKDRLLNRSDSGAIAYLAIEDPAHPWAPLKPGSSATPGPFYLIWKNPERSKIGREEWPFQLSGFTVEASLASRFPSIVPDAKLKASDPVMRGYRVFTSTCFTCHRMNGQGETEIGPDLNLPFNPTEYFREAYLRLLIRNPQNVRHWPEGGMTEFSPEDLSDSQIDDVVKYLRHMAKRKVTLPASAPDPAP